MYQKMSEKDIDLDANYPPRITFKNSAAFNVERL